MKPSKDRKYSRGWCLYPRMVGGTYTKTIARVNAKNDGYRRRWARL